MDIVLIPYEPTWWPKSQSRDSAGTRHLPGPLRTPLPPGDQPGARGARPHGVAHRPAAPALGHHRRGGGGARDRTLATALDRCALGAPGPRPAPRDGLRRAASAPGPPGPGRHRAAPARAPRGRRGPPGFRPPRPGRPVPGRRQCPRERGQPQPPRPAPRYEAPAVLEALPADRWPPLTWRAPDDGVLRQQFAALRGPWATGGAPVSPSPHRVATGPEGWLLGARPVPGERGEVQGAGRNLPAASPRHQLGEVAPSRWPLAPCDEDAQGAWGLDHDQGRRWAGRPRPLAVGMRAYSFRARQRGLPAKPAGLSPRWGAPVVPSGPAPGAPVALPRCGVVAHRDHPDGPVPPQAALTK